MTQQATTVTNIPGPPPLGGRLRIAFLGPFGTFTEQAVWQIAPAGAELIPAASAPQALEAVRNGVADRAVVPIENSIEGGVNATIDTLSRGEDLHIVAEMGTARHPCLCCDYSIAPHLHIMGDVYKIVQF